MSRTTKASRQAAYSKLSKQYDVWITMTNEELFAEVRKEFPIVTEATRDECLKFLTMSFVDRFLVP